MAASAQTSDAEKAPELSLPQREPTFAASGTSRGRRARGKDRVRRRNAVDPAANHCDNSDQRIGRIYKYVCFISL
jgi:hypothetical protein